MMLSKAWRMLWGDSNSRAKKALNTAVVALAFVTLGPPLYYVISPEKTFRQYKSDIELKLEERLGREAHERVTSKVPGLAEATYQATPFILVDVRKVCKPTQVEGVDYGPGSFTLDCGPIELSEIRLWPDRFIIASTAWIMLLIVINVATSAAAQPPLAPTQLSSYRRPIGYSELHMSSIVTSEVGRRFAAASMGMLLVGLTLAFLGAAIFYWTMPTDYGQDWKANAFRTIRPAIALLFVESVAWFLLRQYNTLRAEYRALTQLHMHRNDLLAVAQIMSDPESSRACTELAKHLLSIEPSDLTGSAKDAPVTPGDSGAVERLSLAMLQALQTRVPKELGAVASQDTKKASQLTKVTDLTFLYVARFCRSSHA